MNYFLLYIALVNLFSSMHAMDHLPQTPSIWAITCDNELIKIDKVIAQQSNLLMFLQQKYPATAELPLLIPISKNDFDFFCSCLTIPASQLLTNLSDKKYSKIMDIAEKLKCPIFYAELMEALMVEKKIVNTFALNHLNDKAIIKPIVQQFTEKKRIKKSKWWCPSRIVIEHSPDGNYFIENIPTYTNYEQLHLWITNPLKLIKTFSIDCTAFRFSPDSKYIVVAPAASVIPMKVSPILYSIEQNRQYDLISDYQLYLKYHITFDSKNQKFLQLLLGDNNRKKLIITELLPNNELETIEIDAPSIRGLGPVGDDSERSFNINDKKQLLLCKTSNPLSQHVLLENYEYTQIPTVLDINPLLIYYPCNEHTKLISFSPDLNNQDLPIIKSEIKLTKAINEHEVIAYSSKHKMIAYRSKITKLQVSDSLGNKIAFHKLDPAKNITFKSLLFNKAGDYLVSLCNQATGKLQSLIFWDFNNPKFSIPGIKIDRPYLIENICFTKGGNLLTKGNRTELWDMQGNKLATVAKQPYNCTQVSANHFLLAKKISEFQPRTKLYHVHIDENQIAKNIQEFKEKLSLSQALLLNAYHFHRKDKNPTILYPNMPNGRALASLQQEDKFLAKKFKLAKDSFIPKTLSVSQQKTLQIEQS